MSYTFKSTLSEDDRLMESKASLKQGNSLWCIHRKPSLGKFINKMHYGYVIQLPIEN